MNALTPTHAHLATPVDPAAPVRRFVADHYDALWQAARLLGGYDAARLVASLATALASGASPSRLTRRQLYDLRDLLTLENVHDANRVEWGFFAAIDPADPCVADICLLADGLCDVMAAWQRAERRAGPRHPLAGAARQAA